MVEYIKKSKLKESSAVENRRLSSQ